MRTVSFIGKAEHSRIMRHLYDRAKIAADTVISRIIYQYGNSIRMLIYRLLYIVTAHAESDTEPVINIRININRYCTAKDQGIDNASVHISRQYDLISLLAA